MGVGPADAELMVVGEQPGDQEDVQGEPFVGPAGRLLRDALRGAGIDPDRVFRTNVVKHFRIRGTDTRRRIHRPPDLGHIHACGPWFDAELKVVKPTAVVLLGASAGKAVFGPGFRVTKERGHVLEWPSRRDESFAPSWVLATIHPSAVLRSDNREAELQGLVDDLVVAREALAAPQV